MLRFAPKAPWWALFGSLLACGWTPEVRPVEPRAILKGPHYVLDHEAVRGEDYVFIVRDYPDRLLELFAQGAQGDEPAPDLDELTPSELRDALDGLQRDILDVGTGESCRVPGRVYAYYYERLDAESTTVDRWRVAYRRFERGREPDGDDEGEPDRYYLEFMDERCRETGPRIETWRYPTTFREPGGSYDVALVQDASGGLWWADPFEGERRKVADRVLTWSFAVAPPNDDLGDDERGLLILEGEPPPDPPQGEPRPPLRGELVVRNLEGDEIVRFGERVTEGFVQTNYGGLRVAWVTDGVLYEAVAPDLEPVRLTPRDGIACNPGYISGELEFLFPCDEERVNRIDLATGEVQQLETGVSDEWTQRGWSFERRYDADDGTESLWAQPPGGSEIVRVQPRLTGAVPIDAERLLGLTAVEQGFGDVGTWRPDGGFDVLLPSVSFYYDFEDNRYTADREEPVYLWVVHHDVREGVGELSLLSSRDFTVTSIAEGVPLGGFRQYSFTAVINPTIVMLRDLQPDGGVLEARLIPNLLGTTVDDGVIGFTSRSSHQEPGLYYSVGPGEREGIWFAPL